MIDSILTGSDNYVMAKKLLDVTSLRHQALASNLANVDTPGYRRIDLDKTFETQLTRLVAEKQTGKLLNLKPVISEDTSKRPESPDGNNVQLDSELLAVNRNALEYEFLTQMVSGSIKQLKVAITGHNR